LVYVKTIIELNTLVKSGVRWVIIKMPADKNILYHQTNLFFDIKKD